MNLMRSLDEYEQLIASARERFALAPPPWMLTQSSWAIACSLPKVILGKLEGERRSLPCPIMAVALAPGSDELLRGPLFTRLAQGGQVASRVCPFRQRQTTAFQNWRRALL